MDDSLGEFERLASLGTLWAKLACYVEPLWIDHVPPNGGDTSWCRPVDLAKAIYTPSHWPLMVTHFSIGHSPDPDDAFMFYAMTESLIETGRGGTTTCLWTSRPSTNRPWMVSTT